MEAIRIIAPDDREDPSDLAISRDDPWLAVLLAQVITRAEVLAAALNPDRYTINGACSAEGVHVAQRIHDKFYDYLYLWEWNGTWSWCRDSTGQASMADSPILAPLRRGTTRDLATFEALLDRLPSPIAAAHHEVMLASQLATKTPKVILPNNKLLRAKLFRWEWILIDHGKEALARHISAMKRLYADPEMGDLLTKILYADDPDRAVWEANHDPAEREILARISLDPDNHMFHQGACKDDITYEEWLDEIGVIQTPGSVVTVDGLRRWLVAIPKAKRPDLAKLKRRPAKPAKPRRLAPQDYAKKRAEACQLRKTFPDWPHERIAKAVDIHLKTLFKWEQYMEVCVSNEGGPTADRE